MEELKNKEIKENVKEEIPKQKFEIKEIFKKQNRMVAVLIFIAIFILITGINLRANYLEYLELGERYLDVFYTNLTYQNTIMIVSFISIYFIVYMTNRGIKKGLKEFFDKEKKEMPKLLNKSLSLVIATILSIVITNVFTEQIMLALNSTSFGIVDSIFGLDISYFVFLKPLLSTSITYFIYLFIGLIAYSVLYYIIIFNRYFDGIDGEMIWNSHIMKKTLRNIMLITIGIAISTFLNIQNMSLGKILEIGENIELVGAGLTATTIQLWGYILFSIIIIISVFRAIKKFKKRETSSVIKNLAIIPVYLISLFLVMTVFDLVYVSQNKLDKEEDFISENIESTKSAYDLDIEEINLEYTGTIAQTEVEANQDIIDNIPIISEDVVIKAVMNNQTATGQFTYRDVSLAKYELDGKTELVYLAPREIAVSDRTYNNRTYEYTHGMGEVVLSATKSDESGNVEYIQKEISGEDEKIAISEPRIYFGMETNEIVITNTEEKVEYDYTDDNGIDHMSSYSGKAGLELGLLDRLILGISKLNFDLAFSTDITSDSKILLNTQILDRVNIALPYLMYDEEPYTIITDDGNLLWVIDAYTVSSNYPYSQYTKIEYNNTTSEINYIRNSVKVIIDAYDGTMSYYITDQTDPIAMAYQKIYGDLFVDLDEEIPSNISDHFTYPKFLYELQSEVLKVYHNVKPDVLYREDDIWDYIKVSSSSTNTSIGTYLEPYYTMVNTSEGQSIGLIQMYSKEGRQNINSYLVGTSGTENKLVLYKFSEDSNIVSPLQLNNQIEEDETIAAELETLNVIGTKVTKNMIIVPIGGTLLYVEPVYQTMLNDPEKQVPILKKVIVSSGDKVAIGDNFEEALINLLSTEASDIEIENTEDATGLIEAIIKANNNLKDSNQSNDWELMGKDIERLQDLIDSLEELQDTEKDETEELNDEQEENELQNNSENV